MAGQSTSAQRVKNHVVTKDGGRRAYLSEEEVLQMNEFDYIRFTVTDIHGIGRCKSVARRNFPIFAANGVDVLGALIAMGPRSDIVDVDPVLSSNYGNCVLRPMSKTLRALPWAADGNIKVGEVLCETIWRNPETPQEPCPRYIARKQLQRLDDMGYLLLSAFEAEFTVFKKDQITSISEGHDAFSTLDLSQFESYLYGLDQNLNKLGINVRAIHTECGSGQFEFAQMPTYDIEVADSMFQLKNGIKEMTFLKDMEATFMTKPDLSDSFNMQQFNHSLWSKQTKENVFSDPDKPDKLSAIAKHWIAGLIHHGDSLTALCCPTVNCYRMLHESYAPSRVNWGMDDRDAAFRVKNFSPLETYIENRFPSGSANPYLILAATVAAGISGIKNKMECPPPRQDNEKPVVKSLEQALAALEKDEVIGR